MANTKQYDLNGYNCTDYALDLYNSVNSGNLIIVPDWNGAGTGFNYGTTPNGLYYQIQNSSSGNNVYVGNTNAPMTPGGCP